MPIINAEYKSELSVNKLFMEAGTYTLNSQGENNIKYGVDVELESYDDASGTLLDADIEITVASYITFVSDKGYMILNISTDDTGAVFGTVQTKEEWQDEKISGNSTKLENVTHINYGGNKVLYLFGDSLQAQDGVSRVSDKEARTQAGGRMNWANFFMGNPFDIVNKAVAGVTSEYMLEHIQSDVIDNKPDYCSIPLTSNDINTLEDTSVNIINRYIEMFELLTKNNIRIIAGTCVSSIYYFTTGDTASKQATWNEINYWLRNYVKKNKNIILIDYASVGTNPETGQPITDYTDGTHPYGVLAARMGQLLTNGLEKEVTQTRTLPCTNIDDNNKLPNGMMLGDTSGLATGYSVGTYGSGTIPTYTASKEARTDDYGGEIQVIDITAMGDATTLGAFNGPSVVHDFEIGDWIEAEIEIDYSEMTSVTGVSAILILQNSSYGTTGLSEGLYMSATSEALNYFKSGLLKLPPIKIEEGDIRFRASILFYGVGRLKIGTCRVGKVDEPTNE